MRAGIIFGGVFAVGLAAIAFMSMREDPAPAPVAAGAVAAAPEVKAKNIYVAAQPIPIGTVMTQDMLAIQPWPDHLVLDGFMAADDGAKGVVGYVARGQFQQQEPIIKSKLANPNDPSFLAGDLPKGMRVITVITNEVEGVAGFVQPGDHVDVILTHEVDTVTSSPLSVQGEAELRKDSVSETLLTNVKVLAVDQRASGEQAQGPEGTQSPPRSVSLMVSQSDAQRLRLGQKVGTLTLALRALADRDSADPLVVTAVPDISQYKTGGVAQGGSSEIKIYRGAKIEDADASDKPVARPVAPMVPEVNLQQNMGQ